MNPKHNNPTQSDRIAHAPYNFVPLPEQIVLVNSIPNHDVYAGYTGYLDCTLTTLSPTYTRAALNPQFFIEWAERIREMMRNDQAREEYAQFFRLDDGYRPIIPGSSLRGMTRVLVEIVGHGKMQWITKTGLFIRTVDSTAAGKYYRERMTGKVEGGLLWCRRGSYHIKKCQVVRVHRSKLGGKHRIYEGSEPNLTPRWSGQPAQYIPVWVRLSDNRRFVEDIKYQQTDDSIEGRLVITGDIPRKKKEFVFLLPEQDAEEIAVSEELIRRFHDEDQVTQWQEKAFSKDKPQRQSRQRDGMLRKDSFLQSEGDPIFFLRENGTLTFFGRAQMFRLPYTHSPLDLAPEGLRQYINNTGNEVIDIAEAIFGYIAEDGRSTGRAGRVYFTDAECNPNQESVWLSEGVITPQVLGSPKPTTFQHYLIQDKGKGHDPDDKRRLAHYGTPAPDETVIRGHKLYWHKGKNLTTADISERDPVDWSKDTQHTQIKPVNAGVTFLFRVYFENLTEVELGALLWVLDLPEGHHHKIGMGKSLGLGSVAIKPRLILGDRPARYRQLFDGNTWYTGEQEEPHRQQFQQAFEQYILKHMSQEERKNARSLAQVTRIRMLLKMLEWPGPDRSLTKYMVIEPENEYKERPVLPDPLHIEEPPGGSQSSARSPMGRQRGGYRPDKRRGGR
jgi:CRISPR-associated protein (TIGR03986 family)